MATLWILSDLHLETLPDPDHFRPAAAPLDVLVAAGDIPRLRRPAPPRWKEASTTLN